MQDLLSFWDRLGAAQFGVIAVLVAIVYVWVNRRLGRNMNHMIEGPFGNKSRFWDLAAILVSAQILTYLLWQYAHSPFTK